MRAPPCLQREGGRCDGPRQGPAGVPAAALPGAVGGARARGTARPQPQPPQQLRPRLGLAARGTDLPPWRSTLSPPQRWQQHKTVCESHAPVPQALLEKANWLGAARGASAGPGPKAFSLSADPFGRALLGGSLSEGTLRAWASSPVVGLRGERGPLFDLVEVMPLAPAFQGGGPSADHYPPSLFFFFFFFSEAAREVLFWLTKALPRSPCRLLLRTWTPPSARSRPAPSRRTRTASWTRPRPSTSTQWPSSRATALGTPTWTAAPGDTSTDKCPLQRTNLTPTPTRQRAALCHRGIGHRRGQGHALQRGGPLRPQAHSGGGAHPAARPKRTHARLPGAPPSLPFSLLSLSLFLSFWAPRSISLFLFF